MIPHLNFARTVFINVGSDVLVEYYYYNTTSTTIARACRCLKKEKRRVLLLLLLTFVGLNAIHRRHPFQVASFSYPSLLHNVQQPAPLRQTQYDSTICENQCATAQSKSGASERGKRERERQRGANAAANT